MIHWFSTFLISLSAVFPAAAAKLEGCAREFHFSAPFTAAGWSTRALPRSDAAEVFSGFAGLQEPVVRFNLLPNDFVRGGKRSELTDLFTPAMNSTVAYDFSVYIPSKYPIHDGNSTVIAQWHTPSDDLKPPIAVRYRQGRIDITLNHLPSHSSDPGPSGQINLYRREGFPKAQWQRFRFEIHWADDASGSVKTWINDVQVVNYTGPTEYVGEKIGPYFKYGLYVSKPLARPYVMYHGPYRRECIAGSVLAVIL